MVRNRNNVTVTLSQAKLLIKTLAHTESLFLLSPPGVGKSETVVQAAQEAGLECRSLLGTQIAPEDVSGIPRVVEQRSVYCPPMALLPEPPKPFCLFLDEFPSCDQDVQKAFYSLLLERRVGEHILPKGTWVVAAGNRIEDNAMVKMFNSALLNRVFILNVRVDVNEWLNWASARKIRNDIVSFITFMPESLMRSVPPEPVPFSSPRAWASLSSALDMCESKGICNLETFRALAFARVSAEDAGIFCAMVETNMHNLKNVKSYILEPSTMPSEDTQRWFLLSLIRDMASRGKLNDLHPTIINRFLMSLPEEQRFVLFLDRVGEWGNLGADEVLFQSLQAVTGLPGLNYAERLKKTKLELL